MLSLGRAPSRALPPGLQFAPLRVRSSGAMRIGGLRRLGRRNRPESGPAIEAPMRTHRRQRRAPTLVPTDARACRLGRPASGAMREVLRGGRGLSVGGFHVFDSSLERSSVLVCKPRAGLLHWNHGIALNTEE